MHCKCHLKTATATSIQIFTYPLSHISFNMIFVYFTTLKSHQRSPYPLVTYVLSGCLPKGKFRNSWNLLEKLYTATTSNLHTTIGVKIYRKNCLGLSTFFLVCLQKGYILVIFICIQNINYISFFINRLYIDCSTHNFYHIDQ